MNAEDPLGRTALDVLEIASPVNRQMQKLLKSHGAKHGTIAGPGFDATLAKSGDYRDITYDEPPVFRVRQAVQWASSTTAGREFNGTRPYWLYEGPSETIQGVVVAVEEMACQVKVTKGAGAFRPGSIHRILHIDLQPAERE